MTRVAATLLVILMLGFVTATLAAEPDAQAADSLAARVEQGKKVFMAQGCYGCHMVGTMGTPIGPDLSLEGRRRTEEYLLAWLEDPRLQKPTAHMPKIQLAPDEIEALAAFLSSLR
jgi:cytochrome c oxidase subunit 2